MPDRRRFGTKATNLRFQACIGLLDDQFDTETLSHSAADLREYSA